MTREELNTEIDEVISNEIEEAGIAPAELGTKMKRIADYADGIVYTKVKKRVISSAELLAIFTTPIDLVAGVAGKILIPTFIALYYDFGTVEYSGGGSWKVSVGDNHNISAFSAYTGVNYNVEQYKLLYIDGWNNSATPLVNTPIKLTTAVALTAGDGTVTAYITYNEITL